MQIQYAEPAGLDNRYPLMFLLLILATVATVAACAFALRSPTQPATLSRPLARIATEAGLPKAGRPHLIAPNTASVTCRPVGTGQPALVCDADRVVGWFKSEHVVINVPLPAQLPFVSSELPPETQQAALAAVQLALQKRLTAPARRESRQLSTAT